MNRPGHRIAAWLGKAALKTHALQTLRDCRASPNGAKRLECVRFIGAFRTGRDDQRFMAPMRAKNESRLSMNRRADSHVRADMAGRAPAVQRSWSQCTAKMAWGLS